MPARQWLPAAMEALLQGSSAAAESLSALLRAHFRQATFFASRPRRSAPGLDELVRQRQGGHQQQPRIADLPDRARQRAHPLVEHPAPARADVLLALVAGDCIARPLTTTLTTGMANRSSRGRCGSARWRRRAWPRPPRSGRPASCDSSSSAAMRARRRSRSSASRAISLVARAVTICPSGGARLDPGKGCGKSCQRPRPADSFQASVPSSLGSEASLSTRERKLLCLPVRRRP